MKRQCSSTEEDCHKEDASFKLTETETTSFIQKGKIIHDIFSYINSKKHIVVLVGAGISVDSGIPDFRSKNGFFHIIKETIPSQYSVEDVFDSNVFTEDPSLFYTSIQHIYTGMRKNPKPSIVHQWLMTLPIQHLFTQNIDGLESSIACPKSYLHGCLQTGTCMQCGKRIDENVLRTFYRQGTVAHCGCGGVVKPDIIFYGDLVQQDCLKWIENEAVECDLLLILGTSLSTYPVSNCISLFQHCDIIVMNQTNIHIPNRDPHFFTIQLLGSFQDLLGHKTDCVCSNLESVKRGNVIVQYKNGFLQKRKYLQEWTIL